MSPRWATPSTVALIMNRDLIACVHMYLSAQKKASICHTEATDNYILWNLDMCCNYLLKRKKISFILVAFLCSTAQMSLTFSVSSVPLGRQEKWILVPVG